VRNEFDGHPDPVGDHVVGEVPNDDDPVRGGGGDRACHVLSLDGGAAEEVLRGAVAEGGPQAGTTGGVELADPVVTRLGFS
jgi:hypothetical protein